jgi:hypothetical protein
MLDWMKEPEHLEKIWGRIKGRVVSEWINFCAAARHGSRGSSDWSR